MPGIISFVLATSIAFTVPTEAESPSSSCRFKNNGWWNVSEVKHTIRCAADIFHPPGGKSKALSVADCESNFHAENGGHYDSYHGTYQYMTSTFKDHQNRMPAVVNNYSLAGIVHNARANIMTAIAWASKHGWSPWSCA
jgi:hypothetical protein